MSGIIEANSVIDFIKKFPKGTEFLYTDEGMILEALLMTSKCHRGNLQSAKEPYKRIYEDENKSQKERDKAAKFLDLFGYIEQQSDYGLLEYLSKKIEILDQFSTD